MALLASGTYLEDKNMAVMNPMGGGIDSAVTQRMQRMQNDPNALGQQAQKSGDILDLIAARRAADLVAEQKKLLALQMNGSPSTIKDQVGEELVASQKEQMKGPLQDLRGRTQGVGGVLGNQQRQQQMQGAPTMAAAQGGIINAPAPNLTRMYNGGIVGYAKGGEISREEYIAKVKALVASGVAQEDAMAQMDAEFDISSGTREKRRDVSLEDNRLLPKGNRRSIRGDEVYGTEAPKPPGFFMGKSTQGNQSYDEPDPEGDLLAAIAGEKQPEAIGLPKRELGTTAMGMGAPPIQEDIVAPVDPAPTDAPADPKPKPEGIETVLPNPYRVTDGKNQPATVSKGSVSPPPAMASLERDRLAELKAEATKDIKDTPEGLTGSAAIKAQLDKMGGKKGIAGLVERFANTNFRPSYGGTGEALAEAGRNISEAGQKEKAANRKFLEGQLGVQQSIEAAQVSAAAEESQFGRGLAETQAARKQAGDEFNKKFTQLNTQFDDKLAQDGTYQSAKIEVDKRANEIRAITESNNTALLSANNSQQVFAILQTMRSDYDKMIAIEVENILARQGEDYAAKKAEADAHRETRNAEFTKLQRSLVGTLGSGGSGGDSSAKAAASKILGT